MIQLNPNRKPENVNPDASEKTATNSFTTLDGGLVSALNVAFTPIQDLHGYSKPWPGGAGKNELPMTVTNLKSINTSGSWSDNVYTFNSVTFTVQTDSDNNVIGIAVNTSGATANTDFRLANNPAFVGTHIMSGCPATGSDSTYFLYYSDNVNSVVKDYGSGANITPYSTPSPYAAIRVASGASLSDKIFEPMFRLASIADSTFEPYSNICPISGHTQVQSKINNTTYTTSLGGTYTKGWVNQVDGSNEILDNKMDLGTLTYNYDSTNRRFTGFISGIKNTTARTMKIVSDIYEVISNGQAFDVNWDNVIYNSGNTVMIHNHAYTDPATFKTAMSGYYITYDLATPTTLTLTGQSITAEVGENNVSAPLTNQEIVEDGVTYKEMFSWADIVAYVQSQVNP